MNKRNTEKLYRSFPDLFKNRENPKISRMADGFMCHDGWFDLIFKLCQDLQKELDAQPEMKPDVYAKQVKEKFGGLRFYISCGTDKMHELIHKAEAESYKICELCGAPGTLTVRHGYWQTLCEKHRKIKGATADTSPLNPTNPLKHACISLILKEEGCYPDV